MILGRARCSPGELSGTARNLAELDGVQKSLVELSNALWTSAELSAAWQSSKELNGARWTSAEPGGDGFATASSNYHFLCLLTFFHSLFIFIHHYSALRHFVTDFVELAR